MLPTWPKEHRPKTSTTWLSINKARPPLKMVPEIEIVPF